MTRNTTKMVSLLLGVLLLAGCEWTGTTSSGSWNSEYNWANFSGVYRSPSGGILVTSFTSTPGTEAFEQSVTGETVGSANGSTQYGGTVANTPVVAGTLSINAGNSFFLFDNGDGTLTGNDGSTGSIEYQTGAWAIDVGVPLVAGNITASYVFVGGGTSPNTNPGNTGTPIYSLTVHQEGNKLAITASDGTSFSGNMGSVRSTTGNVLETQEGVIVAQFEVSGTINGQTVRIVGTFQGTVAPATQGSVMFDRQMSGTWIEEGTGVTADLLGVAGTVAVELPDPNYDTRPTFTTTGTGTGTGN